MYRRMKFKSSSVGHSVLKGRSIAVLTLMAVMLCCACGSSGEAQSSDKGKDKDKKKGKNEEKKAGKNEASVAGNAINGGPYEASGVVQVPGTDKVLFVDDGRPGEVLLMQVDESGQQVGAVKSLSLGVHVENPEGITCDGTRFYVVGSQSNPKRGELNAIARFAFDSTSNSVSNAEVIKDFRSLLLKNVADLKGDGEKRGVDGGLNIEGLAWDPQNGRLLLGLRSPIRGGNGFVLPVKLRDPNGAFTADNLDFTESKLIALALGGQGVREIQYDSGLKAFMVISGAPENAEKGEFVLWQWDGSTGGAKPARKASLDPGMKPEGLTEFRHGDQRFMFVMGDASRYMKMDY